MSEAQNTPNHKIDPAEMALIATSLEGVDLEPRGGQVVSEPLFPNLQRNVERQIKPRPLLANVYRWQRKANAHTAHLVSQGGMGKRAGFSLCGLYAESGWQDADGEHRCRKCGDSYIADDLERLADRKPESQPEIVEIGDTVEWDRADGQVVRGVVTGVVSGRDAESAYVTQLQIDNQYGIFADGSVRKIDPCPECHKNPTGDNGYPCSRCWFLLNGGYEDELDDWGLDGFEDEQRAIEADRLAQHHIDVADNAQMPVELQAGDIIAWPFVNPARAEFICYIEDRESGTRQMIIRPFEGWRETTIDEQPVTVVSCVDEILSQVKEQQTAIEDRQKSIRDEIDVIRATPINNLSLIECFERMDKITTLADEHTRLNEESRTLQTSLRARTGHPQAA